MPIITIPQPEMAVGTQITKLAFLKRFTNAEAVAIDLASIGATEQAATIRRYLKLVDSSTYIDLSREDLMTDLATLESVNLLAAGRAQEIIGAPIQPIEVPTK